ncbi:MAG: PadR family transcriptional regulator [Anaerolineaceae bacterium]|nr:PadR family transcriptional regulator [Anaerolineaceae bacterium]
MIQYILLGFLNYQPMTGYDLKRALDHSTGHFWHAYHSQIYTTLRQMEKDGLVTSQFVMGEGQPDRRTYTITEQGREMLSVWLSRPLTEAVSVKEELLVRLFFSGQRSNESILAELTVQREIHQQKLAEYRKMQQEMEEQAKCLPLPSLQRDSVFWMATLKMGMRYEQAYLDWLSETIQTVQSL